MKMSILDNEKLTVMIEAAHNARRNAYAPYSGFKVGAAVLGGSSAIYTGCNIENASYGLTICAERVAIFKAISEGETVILAVVIVAGEHQPSPPCGACLQVISEFSPSDEPVTIVTCAADGSQYIRTLKDYLPTPFRLKVNKEQ
jgi:cytidine deaminase